MGRNRCIGDRRERNHRRFDPIDGSLNNIKNENTLFSRDE